MVIGVINQVSWLANYGAPPCGNVPISQINVAGGATYLKVSQNGGTPKWFVYKRESY